MQILHLNPFSLTRTRTSCPVVSIIGTVYFKCKEVGGYILFVILNAIHFILRIVQNQTSFWFVNKAGKDIAVFIYKPQYRIKI